jgi:flagellin
MPLSINTNVASLTAQRAMMNSNAGLESAFERLSTGKRINSASDDAAGLAIGKDLESRVSGLNQAIRNANDAISMVQIAEGSLDEATTILQRMRDLSVQAANGSLSSAEQGYLDTEQEKLATALNDVLKQAKFDDITLIDNTASASNDMNSTKTFQIGADSTDTMNVVFQGLSDVSLGVSAADIALDGTGAQAETVAFSGFALGTAKATVSFGALSNASNVAATDTLTVTIDGTAYTHQTANVTSSAELISELNDAATGGGTLLSTVGSFSDIGGDLVFTYADATASHASGTNSLASDGQAGSMFTVGTAGGTVGQSDQRSTDVFTLTVGADTFATAAGARANNKAVATALQASLDAVGVTDFSVATAGGADNGAITITYAHKGDQALNNSDYKLEKTTGIDGTSGSNATSAAQSDGLADASGAITIIDKALALVADDRARLGATQSQLESTVRNLANVAENTSAAAGRIMDTDYAAETANLTKAQILQQAATSILAQANAQPQSVLSLLQ